MFYKVPDIHSNENYYCVVSGKKMFVCCKEIKFLLWDTQINETEF